MPIFRKKPKKRQTGSKEKEEKKQEPSESLKNPSHSLSNSSEGVGSEEGLEGSHSPNESFSTSPTGTETYSVSIQESSQGTTYKLVYPKEYNYDTTNLEYGLKDLSTEEKSTVALSNKFDEESKKQLESCSPKLQELCNEIIEKYDFLVIKGARTKKEQNELYRIGKSGVFWPGSKHNLDPKRNPEYSLAVDMVPKIKGEVVRESSQLLHFVGYVKAVANSKGIQIRNKAVSDNHKVESMNFEELTHFELEE